jgi:hypothetical protein
MVTNALRELQALNYCCLPSFILEVERNRVQYIQIITVAHYYMYGC